MSTHVSYSMLVVFYRLNPRELPPIARLTLIDPDQSPEMDHEIMVINLSRKPGERFFDKNKAAHRQGFVCDPWLHQAQPFTAMDFLAPGLLNYRVEDSYELSSVLRFSDFPEDLSAFLQGLLDTLIQTPYLVPEDALENFENLRSMNVYS